MEWKKYRKRGLAEMREYIEGEDLAAQGITINLVVDHPEKGGMIARNPRDHSDQWYVSKSYFDMNFELEEK